MDEFGGLPIEPEASHNEPKPKSLPPPPPDVQVVAPFVGMMPQQPQPLEKEGTDEAGGGCCKCIIM